MSDSNIEKPIYPASTITALSSKFLDSVRKIVDEIKYINQKFPPQKKAK